MTAESTPEQEREQQALVQRAASQELVVPETRAIAGRLGFSAELFPRLMKVNEALKGLCPSPESMRVVTVPGKSPRFDATIDYSSYGYYAVIEGNSSNASFAIETREKVGMRLFMLKFPDIQSFIADVLPETRVSFRGIPSYPDEQGHFEEADEFIVDLRAVTEDSLKQILREQKKEINSRGFPTRVSYIPYHNFQVEVEGQQKPFMELRFFMGEDVFGADRELLAFPLDKLQFDGRAKEVEEFMDKLPALFDKPEMYPFTQYKKGSNYRPVWDNSAPTS